MKKCKNCGQEFEDGANVCPVCGAADNGQSAKVCPNCKTEVSDNSNFCTNCGTPINGVHKAITGTLRTTQVRIISGVRTIASRHTSRL